MRKVSFCIVLYKQSPVLLERAIRSCLLYKGEKRIYLIDNSTTDALSSLQQIDAAIEYVWIGKNAGFGKANNIAIQKAHEWGSQFHFFVNPDIYYTEDVAEKMTTYMENNPNVGGMMPQILNPDGTNQYLPKLIPSLWKLFWRKCPWPQSVHRKMLQTFEMRKMRQDKTYEILHVTGCFCVYRTDVLFRIGGFDDRYFMYFEDTDLSRTVHATHLTLYYPFTQVFHDYGNGAAKEARLFGYFLVSAFKYFCKWGWIDFKGHRLNQAVLKQLDD